MWKSKVMMYSLYVNVGRMHVRLDAEPVNEVVRFNYLV